MLVLGISGSPSAASKTLMAVRIAIEAAGAHTDVTAEVLNLRDHDVVFSDGRDPAAYEGDTRAVIDRVVAADALILGTPMYRGGYTGRLKNLFDVLPNDALEGKPVGLVATGGTDHHYLAIEHELSPLVGFFRAYTVPGAVYANNGHFSAGELVDDGIREGLRRLSATVVEFATRMPREVIGTGGPEIPRKSLEER